MKRMFLFCVIAAAAFSGCDMVHINKDGDAARRAALEEGMSEEEMLLLEKEGHFLKLVNMPVNTQTRNVSAAGVHNSAAEVGKMDTKNAVRIYRDAAGKTSVYINLIYASGGGAFVEDGSFLVSLAVFIDALTWINLAKDAGVLVPFAEGRGTLDVLTLPEGSISTAWPAGGGGEDLKEKEDAMRENGRYLLLSGLPAGVLADMISGLSVSDGAKAAAQPDPQAPPLIVPAASRANVYIPLTSPSGAEFTRTGQFLVTFTVHIDALTKITVTRASAVIVPFESGRGVVDIDKLLKSNPETGETIPDPDTEGAIEDIIAAGSYIRFFNAPRNAGKNSFSAISVSNGNSIVARASDYDSIVVRKNILDAEAFVKISSHKGEYFDASGSLYVAFSIIVDALTKIVVLPSYASLYTFAEGVSEVDVSRAPPPPEKPPLVPHALSIGGLPAATGAPNIADVLVHNAAGVVAKCPDYTKITLTPYNGMQTAIIPLVYDNNKAFNGQPFSDNGTFVVTFTVYPDATRIISIVVENNCLVSFENGSAYLDISAVPPVPRNCLTVTNLPLNTQVTDIAQVFIHNQAGKIAQCQGYEIIECVKSGNTATLRIPLVYPDKVNNKDVLFAETGSYIVTFDLNVDALTRIVLDVRDSVYVAFEDGSGTLDARNLPAALPIPYLTIMGLPVNTAKGNFSDIFLYNIVGKVAKCPDYLSIIISKTANSATAMIPLVYESNSKEYFRDSGEFVVTFTVQIDINTQIIKARTDNLAVRFTDGSGQYNLSDGLGYFSGGLVSYTDTAPPVIKAGTIFEMNGGYEKVTANTGVTAASFDSTRVLYVYAYKRVGSLFFEYSTTTPAWNAAKKGYYSGDRRALYKLLYINDTAGKYVAKTYISDSFKNFDHYVLSNPALSRVSNHVYWLDGGWNPAPQSFSGNGWYLIQVAGGGGAGGGGINGANDNNSNREYSGGAGGAGGIVSELVYLSSVSLMTFTGSGGYGGVSHSDSQFNGVGAGGGGSGAFVYNADGYFLCAGGGGGGGGAAACDATGGTGGGGGAVGSGGGGGGGGGDNGDGSKNRSGSGGGSGGGYSGGAGGGGGGQEHTSAGWGGNGWSALGGTFPGENAGGGNRGGRYEGPDDGGGWGGIGGAAAVIYYNSPDDWKNTAGANGVGGSSGRTTGQPGGAGGNNRTAARGGGGAGGGGGQPADNATGCGGQGGAGYVSIYKIF